MNCSYLSSPPESKIPIPATIVDRLFGAQKFQGYVQILYLGVESGKKILIFFQNANFGFQKVLQNDTMKKSSIYLNTHSHVQHHLQRFVSNPRLFYTDLRYLGTEYVVFDEVFVFWQKTSSFNFCEKNFFFKCMWVGF